MASQIKGDSVKAQGLLEELFLPRSVLRAVKDIKTLQLQGQHQMISQILLHRATVDLRLAFDRHSSQGRLTMRLPGTFNIINNDLPTAQFLLNYQALKQRQQARKGATNNSTAKASDAQTKLSKGDIKVVTDTKVSGNDNNDDATGRAAFTLAQDLALIELKLKDTQWKAIATELGKGVHQVKERFKRIKPDDFDKRHQELKSATKAEKPQQGGEPADGANKDSQNNEQNQQQQGGSKKGKKNKGKAQVRTPEEGEAEGGEGGEGGEWWEQIDGNWSKNDLEVLTDLANQELSEAFVQIAARMATECGKEVHPASVAEKILGSKPDWM